MKIEDNIHLVWENIHRACARVGRDASEVTLIAVSKTHSYEAVLEAIEAGVTHFGENRVEEATGKIAQVRAATTAPTWHMIGHVQSRKARDIPPLIDVVHSVDSVKVAVKLAESAVSIEKYISIFLEINISGEQSKEGLAAFQWKQDAAQRETLWQNVREIIAQPNLRVGGLMTMAPYYDEPQQTRSVFIALRELRDELQASLGVELPEVSMGMTNDYEVAIEEGATHIRVGRAIFGEREIR
jgi:hypothetical protein